MANERLGEIMRVLQAATNNKNRVTVMNVVIELVNLGYETGTEDGNPDWIIDCLEDAKVIV